MNYAFPALDTSTNGQVYDVPVPMSKYLEASFDEGMHYTVLNSLNRMSEMSFANADDSPMLTAEQANKDWAVGNMKFTGPTRTSVARIMNRRKREEMDKAFFLEQGSSKARFLPGMAAAMIGSVTNPLDLGLMFVPFVGEEAAVAKATGPMGKMLARKLVTREVLKDVFPRAPMLTESVINGMVGQTLFEVPAVFASAQDMSDYGPAQSLMNIAAGGTFAAGLHGLAKLVQRLGNGTKVEMARQALTQVLQDEPIRVHDMVRVDEQAIWEKIKFDDDAARSAAYDNIDMDLLAKVVREQYGEKVESPAIKLENGEIHFGESHDKIWYGLDKETRGAYNPDNEGFKTDKGRFISRDEAGKLVGLPDTGYNHLMHENDKLMSEAISTANPEQLGTAEYDRYQQLIEENPQLSKAEALKKIYDERQPRRDRYLMEQPEIQARLEEYRKQEIDNYIAKERAKFEQEKQGRFDALKQQEIEAQIKAGKTLSPEDIQKAIPATKFADMAEGDLDADIAALKKQQGIDEKPAGETGKKEEDPGLIAGMIKGVDAAIKSLDHDPTKMSLPLADLLTLGIGRPVLKGLLMAVKEGLVLFNDLAKAIDHAMEWYGRQDKLTWKESVFHGTQEGVKSFIDSDGNLRFKVMNPKPQKGELGSTFSDDIELSREYGSTIFEVDKSAIQGHAQILEQGGNEWNHKWDSGDLVIPAGKWKVASDQIRAKLEQAVNNEAFSKESKVRVTIDEKPAEGKDAGEQAKAEEKNIFHRAAGKVDEYLKELNKPSDKMFTGIIGIEPLIALVGKEVTKGLLIAVREGLQLTGDLAKALDHAMEWLKKQGEKPEVATKAAAEIKLAKEEIKQRAAEAKTPEEKIKWEKLLNPDMSRRGFLGLLGKFAAAVTAAPHVPLGELSKDAAKVKKFYTLMDDSGMGPSGWGDHMVYDSIEKPMREAVMEGPTWVNEFLGTTMFGEGSEARTISKLHDFLTKHGVKISKKKATQLYTRLMLDAENGGSFGMEHINDYGVSPDTIQARIEQEHPDIKFGTSEYNTLFEKMYQDEVFHELTTKPQFDALGSILLKSGEFDDELKRLVVREVEFKNEPKLTKYTDSRMQTGLKLEDTPVDRNYGSLFSKSTDIPVMDKVKAMAQGDSLILRSIANAEQGIAARGRGFKDSPLSRQLEELARKVEIDGKSPEDQIRQHLETAINEGREAVNKAEVDQAPYIQPEDLRLEPKVDAIKAAVDCILAKVI